MLKIDSGKMFCAISNASVTAGGPEEKAFLNRHTGQIVFLTESEGETSAWYGKDVAVDSVFQRADLEANPDQWLEIPKYDRRFEDCDEEEFVTRFLTEYGIEAALE